MRLLNEIEGGSDPAVTEARRRMLGGVADPFGLRTPGRQLVVRAPWRRRLTGALRDLAETVVALLGRARVRVRKDGYRGLAAAMGRRFTRLLAGGSAEGPAGT